MVAPVGPRSPPHGIPWLWHANAVCGSFPQMTLLGILGDDPGLDKSGLVSLYLLLSFVTRECFWMSWAGPEAQL